MLISPPSGLSASMKRLLDSGNLSDVVLNVGGTQINAHRAILAARSDYFKAMFTQRMAESQQGIVKIDDVPVAVFRELLAFVYTGSCRLQEAARVATKDEDPSDTVDDSDSDDSESVSEYEPGSEEESESDEEAPIKIHRRKNKMGKKKTKKNKANPEAKDKDKNKPAEEAKDNPTDLATSLLVLADRFQVEDLVVYCSNYLCRTTTAANAAARLLFADQMNAQSLKNHILSFIWQDRLLLAQIVQTEDYSKLSSALLHEILIHSLPESHRPKGSKRKMSHTDSGGKKPKAESSEGLD